MPVSTAATNALLARPHIHRRALPDLSAPCRLLRVPGSGKTFIGALVIHSKLSTLKAAQQVAVLLAPTNPLAEQVRATGARGTHLPAVRRRI